MVFIFLSGMPVFLLAQNVEKKTVDSVNDLEQVIVSATRNKTSISILPYSANTISRRNLDLYQYRTTPEALVGLTGIFVQKTNHGGGSAFIRGLTGNQTLILVDGIRLNNSTVRYGPNQYLNTIDPYTISKIEIARGTGSVQYGSDALGGVLQVFTNDPSFNTKKRFRSSVTGKAATQNMEYNGRAELEFQSEKLAVLAGYSNKQFGNLVGGDTTGVQSPSGYKEHSYDLKLKWKPYQNTTLTIARQYLEQKDVPLYHRVKLENYDYYMFAPQRRLLNYAKIDVNSNNKWINRIEFITSLQNIFESRQYQKNGNTNRFNEEDKIQTFGAVVDITSNVAKKWTANTGIEYYYDKVNSNKQQISNSNNSITNQRGLYPDNATSGNFSLYTLHHISINRFDIEGGLRYNNIIINIPDSITGSLQPENVTIKPSSLVTNIALLYHISREHSVYSSFSTGYRAPNIDDMGTLGLVDFRYEIPAYDLKPEKSFNTEAGYRFIRKQVEAEACIYYMHLSNLITRVQKSGRQVNGYNVYAKENSQESFIRGAEISVNYRFSGAFRIKTGASYTYGQNLSAGEPIRRIPPLNGRVMLTYHRLRWQAAIEDIFAGKQNRLAKGDIDDNRIPAGGTPGWNILNIYCAYNLHHISICSGLQNIFNRDYRTHGSGINGVGRSAWFALQIKL